MSERHRIAKNSFFLYVLTFANYFIGLLLFPFLSRILSIEGFGLVGFAMTFAMVFQSIVEFGFMISATAKISGNRSNVDRISKIVSEVMTAKILLCIITIAVFWLSATFVDIVADNFHFLLLFVFSSIAAALIPEFYFRGVEQMKGIAIRSVATKSLAIIIVLCFVESDVDLLLIPVAFFCANLISMLWAFFDILSKKINIKFTGFVSALKAIREGLMFFFSRICVNINSSIGALVLGVVFSPNSYELGIYAAALRIASAGEMLLLPVSDSLYPHMINKKDYKLFWKIYLRGVIVWFLCCSLVFVLAPDICGLLFGEVYRGAGDYLRVLLFGTFMAFSSNMFGYNALSPIGLALHANFSIVFSMIFNLIFALTLLQYGLVSVLTVCILVAANNLLIFLYRYIFFYKNRHAASWKAEV